MSNDNNLQHDIISSLPDSMKEMILTCLPLQDAARTSVLSRKWRYTWRKLPHIILDHSLWKVSGADKDDSECDKFVRRVFNVVLNHEGPITKLTLSVPTLKVSPDIDSLLCFLSKTDVEELMLLSESEEYKLPSSFFKYQRLKKLILGGCSMRPPSGFTGFSQLLSIVLWDVAIGSEHVGNFISCCPLLEEIDLKITSTYDSLEIYAPKLRSFKFRTVIKSVYFKHAPLLAEIKISSYETIQQCCSKEGKSTFDELFSTAPMLRDLGIDYHFMRCLVPNGVPAKPSLTAAHLSILSLINIYLEELEEMSCVLFLLRSSPNLQEFNIHLHTADGESVEKNLTFQLLDVEEYSDVKLNQLRRVKLGIFTGTSNEMELTRFLLIKSPRLKKMLIQPRMDLSTEKGFLILKELVRMKRSLCTEVVYE